MKPIPGPNTAWLYLLKRQEVEAAQPIQCRRVRRVRHRQEIIHSFQKDNSSKCWTTVSPPEIPDELRDTERKNRNDFGNSVDSSADGGKIKRRRIDNGVAEIDGNKKQIEFEQTTAVLNIWKESLIKLLARVNCGKVSRSDGSADDISKVMRDIAQILQEAAGKNISVKHMKDLCILFQKQFAENDLNVFSLFVALGDKVGGSNYDIIVQMVLYPRILSLKRTASRSLMNCIKEITKIRPRSLILGVMIPLLSVHRTENDDLPKHLITRSPQLELLTRMIKFMDSSNSLYLFSSCLSKSGGRDILPWNEFTFPLIKVLLSRPLSFVSSHENGTGAAACKILIDRMENYSQEFSTSLKFASIVNIFITKQKDAAKIHKASLERTLLNTKTFLSKSSLKLLEKL